MNKDTVYMLSRLQAVGVTYDDALKMRRVSMTLNRWFELECGNSNDYTSYAIERDELTDKPFMVYHDNNGKVRRYATADREKGALKRLAAIMARYPELTSYIQGDCRGAALYILRAGDIPEGCDVGAYYNRGIAVYK